MKKELKSAKYAKTEIQIIRVYIIKKKVKIKVGEYNQPIDLFNH